MQSISPCNPYHAVVRDHEMWHGRDDKSVFKLYYVDIIGRANPERTEWDKCATTREALREALDRTPGAQGVGFITAFPHITKIFRFGPEAETVLNVRAWNTVDMSDIDLGRSDGYVEFACLAEAALAADEYRFWAQAASVEAYLKEWSTYRDGPVLCQSKLAQYWS